MTMELRTVLHRSSVLTKSLDSTLESFSLRDCCCIDLVANLQTGDGVVHIGAVAAEVALDSEGVGAGAVGYLEVQVAVVAGLAGAVLVLGSTILSELWGRKKQ